MIVNVLGTSCTWFKRKNTAFVLDKKIVFDTPSGSYKDLIKVVNIFDLEAVIITHFHSDHFGDLHCIAAQMIRHSQKMGRTRKLKVFGPAGIGQRLMEFNKLQECHARECVLENYAETVEFIEIQDGSKFELDDYYVDVYEMQHGIICYGFLFTDKMTGKRYGFTADTAICDNLDKMAANSDYLFADMAMADADIEKYTFRANKTHTTYNEFIELTHKYPNVVMYPVHTCDENQERAIKEGLNYLEDYQELDIK